MEDIETAVKVIEQSIDNNVNKLASDEFEQLCLDIDKFSEQFKR